MRQLFASFHVYLLHIFIFKLPSDTNSSHAPDAPILSKYNSTYEYEVFFPYSTEPLAPSPILPRFLAFLPSQQNTTDHTNEPHDIKVE